MVLCLEKTRTDRGMLGLSDLPDDVVVLLLVKLLPSIPHVVAVTGPVSKSWRIGPERSEVWLRLASVHDIRMPIATGRGLRSEKDLRRAFIRGAKRRTAILLADTEATLTKLLQRLKRGEIPRRVLAQHFEGQHGASTASFCSQQQLQVKQFCDVNHRLTLHSGRSLVYVAAWMGRLKTLQRLVLDFAASLDQEDDNGFTPLAVACWAGQNKVVTWILSSGLSFGDLNKKGMPPMTSSCGGKVSSCPRPAFAVYSIRTNLVQGPCEGVLTATILSGPIYSAPMGSPEAFGGLGKCGEELGQSRSVGCLKCREGQP